MMKFTVILLYAVAASAQTNLTSPVTVLPTKSRTAPGQLRFRDKQATPHDAGFQAAAAVPADVIWSLPSADAPGCMISDGARNLSFAPCEASLSGPSPIGGFSKLQNLLLGAETIGGDGWTLVNSETANQTSGLSPNGVTNTAARLANGGAPGGAAWQVITTNALPANYNLSLWAMQGTAAQVALGIWDETTSSWLAGSPSAIALTAAWQRVSVSGTAITGHTLRAYVFADSDSSTSGLDVYVWGAQVDTGAVNSPLTYMRTDTASWDGGYDPWAQVSPFAGAVVNGHLVQTDTAAANWLSGPTTFNSPMVVSSPAPTPTPAITTTAGYIQSGGGFLSVVPGGSWQGFNSQTDGISVPGYAVAQNVSGTRGGYIALAPIDYNPYDGAPCTDVYGNPVQQPYQLPGLSGFGPNDLLIWNSLSPVMPGSGSCGAPLPVNVWYGVNTNGYYYARAGFATDIPAWNSFESLPPAGSGGDATGGGGFAGNNFTAFGYFEAATTGSIVPSLYDNFTGNGLIHYDSSSGTPYWKLAYGTGTSTSADAFLWAAGEYASGSAFNSMQAPNGGFFGKNFTALGYFESNSTSSIVPSTSDNFTGNGLIHYDSSSGTQYWKLAYGTGASTSADAFLWAAGAYYSGAANNTVQIPGGGLTSKVAVATDSNFWLEEPAPALSAIGQTRVYMDNVCHCLMVSQENAAYVPLVGSGTGYWTLTGGLLYPGGIGNKVLVGRTTDDGSGAMFQVAGSINASSTIQANVSPTSNIAFQANGGNFQADGIGNVSGAGRFASNESFDPKAYASSASLTNPSAGYGGIGYKSGSIYWYWNSTGGAWSQVDFAQGPPTIENNQTGFRAIGTAYQNLSPKTMTVAVTVQTNGTGTEVDAYCDSSSTPTTTCGAVAGSTNAVVGTMTFTVLPNYWYKVEQLSTGATVRSWIEWQ